MRKSNKYTYFEKNYFGLRVPTRILKFKRPKWVRLQNFIKKKLGGKKFLKRPSKRFLYLSKKFRRVILFKNRKKNKLQKKMKRVFFLYKKKTPRYLLKLIYKKKYKSKRKIFSKKILVNLRKYLLINRIRYELYKFRKHSSRFTLSYKFQFRRYWQYLSGLNPFKSFVETSRKLNLKHISREKARFRRTLFNLYGIKANFKFKNKDKLTLLSDIWYKPYYLPYQILWNTSLVSSIEEARKKAESREVLLNDASLKGNFMLRYGDILTLKNLSYNFKSVRRKYYIRRLNFKTLLTDYYNQEVFVTKDFSKIGEETLFNATPRVVDIKYLDL